MKNTKNETVLTAAELKKMGDMIADIIETIELYNNALNLVPDGKRLEQGELSVRYQSLYDLTDTMFQKNQKMMKELDYISYTLLENDDEFEIANTRKQFFTYNTEDEKDLNKIILEEHFSF